jgi:hypothetical protein
VAIPDTIGTTYDMSYAGSERSFHVVATLDAINDDGTITLTYVAGFGTMTISSDAVIDATATTACVSDIQPI